MSNTMRRVQAYKRATASRPDTVKFQKVFLKKLIQNPKTKKAFK